MTAHPIDPEALREHLRRLIDASAGPGNPTVSIDDLRALLAAITAAEHRATRAEAQAAIRGRAVAIHRGRTRAAEAERDAARNQYDEDIAYWIAATEAAEAQIKAVKDVLEESEARGPVGITFNGTPFPAWISIATVRRALDG